MTFFSIFLVINSFSILCVFCLSLVVWNLIYTHRLYKPFLHQNRKIPPGAVHEVRHAVFGQFLTLLPLSHFVTHPGTPRKNVTHLGPRFLVGLVHKSWKKSPVQILSQLFAEVFVRGFVRVGFCPLPLLSQCIYYNRKLNITLNYMFHNYVC